MLEIFRLHSKELGDFRVSVFRCTGELSVYLLYIFDQIRLTYFYKYYVKTYFFLS